MEKTHPQNVKSKGLVILRQYLPGGLGKRKGQGCGGCFKTPVSVAALCAGGLSFEAVGSYV